MAVHILTKDSGNSITIMTNEKSGKPTTPVPILVASGIAGDHAAEFYLTFVDWLLRDEIKLMGDLEGEISAWLRDALAKPVKFDRHNVPEQNKGAAQRELMREMIALMVHPQKKEEIQIGNLMASIDSDALNRTLEALQHGDKPAAEKIRADLVKELSQGFKKQASVERVSALASLAARGRALRAGAMCMALYKENPLWLIEQARGGNREAVLKLVKIDKLFLTDSCTSHVIRRAELQIDRIFLGQLARAVTYRPKTNWRVGCRFYIYMLCILGLEMPSLMTLWHRVDPDGKHFASFDAFEKFVERSRKELDRIRAEVTMDNPEKKA